MQQFKHGEIIFREGEESDCCYIVEEGTVEVFKRLKQGTVLLAVLGKGEIIGEMGLISHLPRSASASASGPVTVRRISQSYFDGLFTNQPEEVLLAMRALMERLREMNLKVSKLIDKQSQFQLDMGTPPQVKRVTISPLTTPLKEVMGKGQVITMPCRVGSIPAGSEPNALDWNSLQIPCPDQEQLSRNHFAIQQNQQGLYVVDRGSKLGTIVNDVKIGINFPELEQKLSPGDNVVTAGDSLSPYRFCITWETD